MKCCDNCGKYLSNNMEEYQVGIETHKSNQKNDVFDDRLLLCDTCLATLKEDIKEITELHRRFKNIKIEQTEKME